MNDFFHMGGYALYVWSSYGLALVVLVANLVLPILNGQRQRQALLARLRRRHA